MEHSAISQLRAGEGNWKITYVNGNGERWLGKRKLERSTPYEHSLSVYSSTKTPHHDKLHCCG